MSTPNETPELASAPHFSETGCPSCGYKPRLPHPEERQFGLALMLEPTGYAAPRIKDDSTTSRSVVVEVADGFPLYRVTCHPGLSGYENRIHEFAVAVAACAWRDLADADDPDRPIFVVGQQERQNPDDPRPEDARAYDQKQRLEDAAGVAAGFLNEWLAYGRSHSRAQRDAENRRMDAPLPA